MSIERDTMVQKLRRDYQRAQCIALRNAGMTCRAIAEIVGISKSSVQRALVRFEETGGFHDRRRSGRPKKLYDRNVRMLKRLTESEGRHSARETTIRLNNSLVNPVCRRTVINYLHKCGYEYKTRIKKPYLTKQHQKKRLDWCIQYSNWTADDWKRVIFSDETTFYIIKRKNEGKIWRTKDERWKEGCMQVAAAGGGGRVNFWGAITSEGTGCFRMYSENTNSDVYCDILENYLIPTVQLYQMENNYLYQHDNSRYHVSRQTETKLCELSIQSLEWPAKSPDLNVIEHLWSIIDDKLKAQSISSAKELIEALSAAWLSIKPDLCRKLVFSMSHKIYKCIERNGKSIDC